MSSATDNSIKQWIFDGSDETGRLLRFRSGHSAPPTCILHYGKGERLLSAGRDRAFRVFSVIQVGRSVVGFVTEPAMAFMSPLDFRAQRNIRSLS